jgi:hypothetical protein
LQSRRVRCEAGIDGHPTADNNDQVSIVDPGKLDEPANFAARADTAENFLPAGDLPLCEAGGDALPAH